MDLSPTAITSSLNPSQKNSLSTCKCRYRSTSTSMGLFTSHPEDCQDAKKQIGLLWNPTQNKTASTVVHNALPKPHNNRLICCSLPPAATIGGVYSADGQVVVHRRQQEWPVFRKNSRKRWVLLYDDLMHRIVYVYACVEITEPVNRNSFRDG